MEKLTAWADGHPNVVTILHELWRYQVRSGIFSGFHAYMYGVRPSTADLDLFTHADDFEAMPYFFPGGELRRDKHVVMQDRRGTPIEFLADEFLAVVDGVEIQVVNSRSDVIIDGGLYDLSMSDLAARHVQPVEIGNRVIGMAHVADTIVAKALFQRAGTKSDALDAAGLVPFCGTADDYLMERTIEARFTPREYTFLGQVGLAVAAPAMVM